MLARSVKPWNNLHASFQKIMDKFKIWVAKIFPIKYLESEAELTSEETKIDTKSLKRNIKKFVPPMYIKQIFIRNNNLSDTMLVKLITEFTHEEIDFADLPIVFETVWGDLNDWNLIKIFIIIFL